MSRVVRPLIFVLSGPIRPDETGATFNPDGSLAYFGVYP